MKTIFDSAACPANDASIYFINEIASPQRAHILNNRQHTVATKDFYRMMKADNYTSKFFTKKKNQELGRVEPQPFIDLNNSKYK
jgi:hypothetical protein